MNKTAGLSGRTLIDNSGFAFELAAEMKIRDSNKNRPYERSYPLLSSSLAIVFYRTSCNNPPGTQLQKCNLGWRLT